MLIHRSGVLEAMIALFDELWKRARPLQPEPGYSRPTPVESRAQLDEIDVVEARFLSTMG